ncbi:hypothetical protein F5B20DRAFT_560266 [Whalleya microplaca]|nr:hypothetical protein F5B20DRAFT_560266 [Whalleya microplaca]
MDDFPNRMPRRRQSFTRPDVMAEPATSAASAASAVKPQANDAAVDPDTCRICRGEGTADEPLFYPCKCSGSIKYVHQDCLMEWLSHSQKKHCELCKTPFRFTKLYSPDMPKRLPLHIFVGHMAKYMFRNVLVWLRAALVASVWLGWLPYLMRSVWSFLFWISDDGFGPSPSGLYHRNATAIRRDGMISISVTGTTTCASSPLLAATTTAASIGRSFVDQNSMSNLLKAISRPLNMTTTQSFLAKWLGVPATTEKSVRAVMSNLNLTHVDEVSVLPAPGQHSSLLGDITILKNITRHPAINRTIIAVLEGQVITLLVIVCFILIILVRDYVVQQQPEINMRAAFAAAENEEAAPPAEPVNPVARDPVPDEAEDNNADNDSVVARDGSLASADDNQDDAALGERGQPTIGPRNSHRRPTVDLRQRSTRQDIELTPVREGGRQGDSGRAGPSTRDFEAPEEVKGSQSHLSHHNFVDGLLPDHDEYSDRLRTNTEDNSEDSTQFTAKEYIRIYKQAGGDRERILQIIRDEGLEDRLRYWVTRTHAMATSGRPASRDNSTTANETGSPLDYYAHRSTHSPRSDSSKPDRTGSDTSSWTWSENEDGDDNVGQASQSKGKSKVEGNLANEATTKETTTPWLSWGNDFGSASRRRPGGGGDDDDDDDAPPLFPTATRPRAISDGPQPHNTINMLANNNWSFSDLPPDPPEVPREAAQGLPGSDLSPSVSHPLSPRNGFQDSNAEIPTTHGPSPNVSATNDIEDLDYLDSQMHNNVMSQGMEQRIETEGGMHTPTSSNNDADNAGGIVERAHNGDRAGVAVQHQGGIVDRMADFMWGNVEAVPVDDMAPGEAVDIFGDNQNAPFFDNDHEDEGQDENDVEMAPDVVEAAVAAGIDPEAIEDAEDFEGIMELIGMRGPVAGLFQNAIFCAFLVSTSIFVGIFIPYNIGRVTVWILANPTRLIRMIFSFSKFLQDAALLAVGYTSSFIFNLLEGFRLILRMEQGRQIMHTLRSDARHVAAGAFDRIASSFMSEIPLISVSEIRNFSAISHEALVFVKADVYYLFSSIGGLIFYAFGGDYTSKWSAAKAFVATAGPKFLGAIPTVATHPGSWMINLNLPEPSSSVNPGLAFWDANDRTWAILIGYISFSVLAGLYLGRGTPFFTGRTAQEWEASIIDALNQASGVMKVILIISIEMLIFPLYCGLLLDFALLPLFESASFTSRLLFTYNYPLTSIFVHWFVGTGYMFHFALFVSMCRKIMRKGVLYFIRDPDDPEFHPVRDVLERNVTTQLRKILFSAFVYGALVVVCLGGVVWGLSLALPSVLPIHYSSNEPVLEFPIDLLFYNFLMPLAVRFFKPSDGLHAMYTWWFRRCARALRLTWFLFGERRVDEEGKLTLADDSPYHDLPLWRQGFLEVNGENQVVPKAWRNIFAGGKAKPNPQIPMEEMIIHNANKTRLVESGQLIPNGRFVRSPASDQVKIPKGQSVFLDVSEQDVRRDDKPDQAETDLYSGNSYQLVYVPPWFRVRVFLFILFIWIFAAVTGVGITIVPLVFGRRMFKVLIPSHIRTNDIYAFSIGIYILGSLGYFAFHVRSMIGKLRPWAASVINSAFDRHAVQRGLHVAKCAFRLLYTYVILLVVFPLLITLLIELYLLMPLHTYMYPAGVESTKRLDGLRDGHTIRVIQAWTLGILYLKLGSRALTLYGGRPAHAVRAVLRRGWLEPDVGVLTRAFVIPGITASFVMILTPPLMAWAVLRRGSDASGAAVPHEMQVLVFRLAYPLTALFWAGLLLTRSMLSVFEGWQVRIRDEAYLMGERLHNFGGTATAAKVDSWRGGIRL